MGIVVFAGAVVGLVAAIVAVDLLHSSRQRRRLAGGRRRTGIDEFRAHDDRIQNADYSAFTARSVRNRDRRS